MRNRITYANVAATLALVFSMTGGAIAANHYLINSTGQISPKVIKKLRGHNGKNGVNGKVGATGATGVQGPSGNTGPPGPFPAVLPSGQTETGAWATSDTESPAYAEISFQYPTSKPPTIHLIKVGETPPVGRAGSVSNPKASPGTSACSPPCCSIPPTRAVSIRARKTKKPPPAITERSSSSKTTGTHFDGAGTWAVTADLPLRWRREEPLPPRTFGRRPPSALA